MQFQFIYCSRNFLTVMSPSLLDQKYSPIKGPLLILLPASYIVVNWNVQGNTKQLQIYYRQLGCPRNKQTKNSGSNRNKPKQDLFRLCFGLFRETKNKQFWFVSVCFGVSNLYRNNRSKQNCFETNRNKPKQP
jgi:hypothetical protein